MNYKILQRRRNKYGEIATAFIEGVKTVNMTKKQKVAFIVILSVFVIQLFTTISGTTMFAQSKGRGITSKTEVFQKSDAESEKQKISNFIEQVYNSFVDNKDNGVSEEVKTDLKTAVSEYKGSLNVVAVLQGIIYYISNAQLASIEAINNLEFGDKKMFSGILMGLTVFACIGCIFKLFKHFLDTERHDNVKAISGYFSYIGLVVLFWFAPSITRHIAGLAEPINASKVQSLVTEINEGIKPILQEDFTKYLHQIQLAANARNKAGFMDVTSDVSFSISKMSAFFSIALPSIIQMVFYLFLGTILVTVLAIPLVIITVMIKVLLTVMIYGTQLVFLLAFIPGFDKLWQSMIINMLNILLWSPIFNAVITFIIAIVTSTMGNPSIIGVLWMTVVAFVLSGQAVTITTSAAGVLIQGAGAGMAGAMSSLGSMNATSMAAKSIGGAVMAGGSLAGKIIGGRVSGSVAGDIIASKIIPPNNSGNNNNSNNSNNSSNSN